MSSAKPASTTQFASTPTVILCGVLPPPRNGMAIVTANVAAALRDAGLLLAQQDTTVERGITGMARHLTKAGKVLKAIGLLLAHRRLPGRQFYTQCDANSGKFYTLLMCGAARVLGYRIYLHHHSYFYINKFSPIIALIAMVMGKAGRHILLCDCMEQDFAARYGGADKILTVVVHNRMWFPRRIADRRRAGDGVVIGHLGNLTWEKGSGVFLNLFEALVTRGVNARAVLLGDTPDAALNAKIRDVAARHPDAFKHIEDPAPTPEIKDGFFNEIDYFVMPTMYKVEAQPLVLIEARAMGVPVIATARGCIREDHDGAPNLVVDADADFVAVAGDWLVGRHDLEPGERHAPETDVALDVEQFRRIFTQARAPAE